MTGSPDSSKTSNAFYPYFRWGLAGVFFLVPLAITPWTLFPDTVKWFLIHAAAVSLVTMGIAGNVCMGRPFGKVEKAALIASGLLFPSVLGAGIRPHAFAGTLSLVAVFCMASLIARVRMGREVVLAAVAAGVAAAFLGLLQACGFDPLFWKSGFSSKALSSFGNPNYMADYCAIAAPLCAGLGLSMKKKSHRYLLWACVPILLAGVWVSQSLGGKLAVACGLGVWLLSRKLHHKIRWVLAIWALLWIVTFATGWHKPDSRDLGQHSETVAIRQFMWHVTEDITRNKWLTGVGAGHFQGAFLEQQKNYLQEDPGLAVLLKQGIVTHAHNDLLELAATYGLIGAAGILLFLCTGVWGSLGDSDPLRSSAAAGIFTCMVSGLVSFPFFLPATRLLCIGLVGVALPMAHRTGSTRLKPLTGILALVTLVVGMWQLFPPFAAEVHTRRGWNIFRKGHEGQARAHLEQAVKLDPYNPWPYYYLGIFHASQQQHLRALDDFKQAKTLFDHFFFYEQEGRVYMELMDFKNAIKAFKGALDIYPLFSEAQFNLAVAYYNVQAFGESEHYMHQYLKQRPDDPRAYYNLGHVRWRLDDLDGAQKYYNKALTLGQMPAKIAKGIQQRLDVINKISGPAQAPSTPGDL